MHSLLVLALTCGQATEPSRGPNFNLLKIKEQVMQEKAPASLEKAVMKAGEIGLAIHDMSSDIWWRLDASLKERQGKHVENLEDPYERFMQAELFLLMHLKWLTGVVEEDAAGRGFTREQWTAFKIAWIEIAAIPPQIETIHEILSTWEEDGQSSQEFDKAVEKLESHITMQLDKAKEECEKVFSSRPEVATQNVGKSSDSVIQEAKKVKQGLQLLTLTVAIGTIVVIGTIIGVGFWMRSRLNASSLNELQEHEV